MSFVSGVHADDDDARRILFWPHWCGILQCFVATPICKE
jgi:hypothetical protein